MTKVGLINLGCAKNLVDAEIMLGHLLQAGMTIVSEAGEADAIIVNTCSFIDPAKEESVNAVFEADEVRRRLRPDQALIVSGCMAQRFPEALRREIPEIDAIMGLNEVPKVAEVVRQAISHRKAAGLRKVSGKADGKSQAAAGRKTPSAAPIKFVSRRATYIPDHDAPRFRLTPKHFAFVKIAEGCNHPCTFCVIPQIRGRHRSRTVESVVTEARRLVAEGVKELNLISQDTTYYGLDLWPASARDQRPFDHTRSRSFTQSSLLPIQNPKSKIQNLPTLCTLLRKLDAIPGDFWIRLLYTHPAHWSDELIETIAASKKVVRYVDMPLQHIHPAMLAAMQRETSEAWIRSLIERIRQRIPGIAIRTAFIVGFPGETEKQFNHLLDFIREMKFERLGVFLYSQEEGSRAAELPGQVPEPVKRDRHARAMALQQQLSRERNASLIGQNFRVLVDGPSNKKGFTWIARSEADAPEIDGHVYLAEKKLRPGQFLNVTVTGSSEYDVVAERR
ncbi:MAG: 30S ribosomal protein S12 methylthiotransferase RimO [Verrucomicrobia bacterium]|nr:30S ribosomal protein S12 methylthiotransferase RimO [Verrucomicrobiota bacterium]